MTSARNVWILPDREQSGELEVVENGEKRRLFEVLDTSLIPRELVLGVPESLFDAHPSPSLVYAQFVRLQGESARSLDAQSIFAVSVRCGKDKSGRTVVLTGLQLLSAGIRPQLLPSASLPEPENSTWRDLAERFVRPPRSDRYARYVGNMLHAVEERQDLASFASLDAPKLTYQPDWAEGRLKKKAVWAAAILLIVVLAVLLLMRTCRADVSHSWAFSS